MCGLEEKIVLHILATTAYGQGAHNGLTSLGTLYEKMLWNKDLNISTEEFKKPSEMSITTDCDKWKTIIVM